jgi:hypothetical protein
MYIETRTAHTEVFEDIYRQLNYLCNGLGNTARERITFPSTIQKTLLKDRLKELSGAVSLARLVVQGDNPFPQELENKLQETYEIVGKALSAS